jgi:hypothetical protein
MKKETLVHIVVIAHSTILCLGTIRHILDVQKRQFEEKKKVEQKYYLQYQLCARTMLGMYEGV